MVEIGGRIKLVLPPLSFRATRLEVVNGTGVCWEAYACSLPH